MCVWWWCRCGSVCVNQVLHVHDQQPALSLSGDARGEGAVHSRNEPAVCWLRPFDCVPSDAPSRGADQWEWEQWEQWWCSCYSTNGLTRSFGDSVSRVYSVGHSGGAPQTGDEEAAERVRCKSDANDEATRSNASDEEGVRCAGVRSQRAVALGLRAVFGRLRK